jgi:hypothetical protein
MRGLGHDNYGQDPDASLGANKRASDAGTATASREVKTHGRGGHYVLASGSGDAEKQRSQLLMVRGVLVCVCVCVCVSQYVTPDTHSVYIRARCGSM